jgi:ATP-dependent protease ClpP protease subunit
MLDMKTIRLSGYVGFEITPELLLERLNEANGDDIEVHLNTQGGNVYQGIEVFNLINSYVGHKTVILGALVASIGSYISCAFDTVVAQDLTIFMIHNASQGAWGDFRELRKVADELERLNAHVSERYAKFSGKTIEDTLALMGAETWYYGKEVVEAGFATEYRETGKGAKTPTNVISFAKRTYRDSMDRVAAHSGPVPIQKGDIMDRDTVIKEAKALLASGELKADELVADPSKAELTALGVTDAVAEIKALRAERDKAATEKALDDAFGKDGLLRSYAATATATGKSIEDIRKDPLAIHLAAEKAAGIVVETTKPKDEPEAEIKTIKV